MEDQSEDKRIPVPEIILIFLVVAIVVIAILTLLGPAIGTTPQNIIINI